MTGNKTINFNDHGSSPSCALRSPDPLQINEAGLSPEMLGGVTGWRQESRSRSRQDSESGKRSPAWHLWQLTSDPLQAFMMKRSLSAHLAGSPLHPAHDSRDGRTHNWHVLFCLVPESWRVDSSCAVHDGALCTLPRRDIPHQLSDFEQEKKN